MLLKFAQQTCRILICRRSKTRVQSMKKCWPQRKLRIAVHPLEPRESWPFHIERSNCQAFLIRRGVILEKLCDLEGPTSWIEVVEPRYVELHTMHWIVWQWRLSCRRRRRRLRRLLVHFELRHTMKKIINFRIHGELRGCEFRNCVFQAIWGNLRMSCVCHYCAMKASILHLVFEDQEASRMQRERMMELMHFFIAFNELLQGFYMTREHGPTILTEWVLLQRIS